MKIGDKVRFLNTTGGGIVKSFKNKDIALVEDEDGFEIPILIRECVVIDQANAAQSKQPASVISTFTTPSSSNAIQETKSEEYQFEETKEGEKLSLHIAYLPTDLKSLSTSNYESYLINDSNYFVSFCYTSRNGDGWTTRLADTVEPNTRIFIEEFAKEDLNDLEHTCFQCIAYKQGKSFAAKNPISIDLRIDPVKFYKLHSFRENEYFDEEALIYTLIRKDQPSKELIISAEELTAAMLEKNAERPRRQALNKSKKTDNDAVLEIDLHIHELLDNVNGLSSGEILEYQLAKFNEVIDENKSKKGKKIVFIHGKGNGILKNAISKELKIKHKAFYVQDASFREYGYGATMVTIK